MDESTLAPATPEYAALAALRDRMLGLVDIALVAERDHAERIARVHPVNRPGAINMVHYRALRTQDLRDLQTGLSVRGLSSLGRMEGRVLDNLGAVIRILDLALGHPEPRSGLGSAGRSSGAELLRRNTDRLFGPQRQVRSTRILVTLPSAAADDAELVKDLVTSGADAVRINCAHDDAQAWRAMAAHARVADPQTVVTMDLGGPKLRTGPLSPGPEVRKVKPRRDQMGRVHAPATVWLVGGRPDTIPDLDADADADDVIVTVADGRLLARLESGDTVRFRDARGRHRAMQVVRSVGGAVLLEGEQTAYLVPDTRLMVEGWPPDEVLVIGELPATENFLRVSTGDRITLTASLEASGAGTSAPGAHRIGCTLPEVFTAVAVGHRIAFDDGKIEGVVDDVTAHGLVAVVTDAAPGGTKLRAGKGINLPDTRLPVSALTVEDRDHLGTVREIADVVSLSFVRSAADVGELIDLLHASGDGHLGVVVKIETVEGFRALPEILLELMRAERAGVMIARGDLAVEAGFERLAELQEEILWLCEAAHTPVIWATQVLDSMADDGLPTRAEITDAAAGRRAECVMLNKGPRIVDAIASLDTILANMGGHVDKKSPLLRRLRSWDC